MKKKSNILIALMILAICTMSCTKEKKTDLSIFAGAGLIKPITDLITNFEKKNNIKIHK
jgi:ABC-type molybdate transport system substrate-binding protein